MPTIAAAKLTRAQVFTFFGLKNGIVTKWGRSGYDIPVFDLTPEFRAPSPWLMEALELWGVVFARNNEANIGTYINLILMDVLRDVHRVQTDSTPEKPLTPTVRSPKNILRIVNEVQLSAMVQERGKQIRIVGRFDMGFSLSDPRAGSITPGLCINDSYLAVLQIKGVSYDIESAFNQLVVYIAMVQRARLEKLMEHQVNSKVYGVLSDGDKFLFVCLDNDYTVRS